MPPPRDYCLSYGSFVAPLKLFTPRKNFPPVKILSPFQIFEYSSNFTAAPKSAARGGPPPSPPCYATWLSYGFGYGLKYGLGYGLGYGLVGYGLGYGLGQGWPTQLHHWDNIFVSILKRAAKLPIANSQHFTSFAPNFFDDLFLGTSFFPRYTCQNSATPQNFSPS